MLHELENQVLAVKKIGRFKRDQQTSMQHQRSTEREDDGSMHSFKQGHWGRGKEVCRRFQSHVKVVVEAN